MSIPFSPLIKRQIPILNLPLQHPPQRPFLVSSHFYIWQEVGFGKSAETICVKMKMTRVRLELTTSALTLYQLSSEIPDYLVDRNHFDFLMLEEAGKINGTRIGSYLCHLHLHQLSRFLCSPSSCWRHTYFEKAAPLPRKFSDWASDIEIWNWLASGKTNMTTADPHTGSGEQTAWYVLFKTLFCPQMRYSSCSSNQFSFKRE